MDQVHSHTIPRKPLQRSTTTGNTQPGLLSANTTIENSKLNALDLASTQTAPTIVRRPLGPASANPQPPISANPGARSKNTGQLNTLQLLSRNPSTRRLSKPPKVHVRKYHTRKRLQKHVRKSSSTRLAPPPVFLLQFEKYPYHTQPGTLLGAFSTFATVITAAIRHGAYAFSKAGIKDGSEYLSPTGRIKIIATTVHRTGVEASLPRSRKPVHDASWPGGAKASETEAAKTSNTEVQPPAPIAMDGKEGVLVAVYQSPTETVCIGAFTERRKVWGACSKHRSSLSISSALQESSKWLDGIELPRMQAREAGKGRHEWFVVAHKIDEEVV